MRRGITEETVYVLNPLPPIEDAEVLERAGMSETSEAAKLKPLVIDWQYSFGEEREFIRLEPGQRVLMRVSDAQAFLKECAERGLVTHRVDADEATIARVSAEGLKKAIAFWSDRGRQRLITIRKKLGLTKEEMEDSRHEHWSFYYNQALADLLREHQAKGSTPTRAKKGAAAA
jgi:hypothetical protein